MIVAQRIRSTVNEREQKQLLMDLDVVMRSNACPYIVKFYGALFKEVCLFAFIYCIMCSTISQCNPKHTDHSSQAVSVFLFCCGNKECCWLDRVIVGFVWS